MKRTLVLILLLGTFLQAHPQNATLKGHVHGSPGEIIRLLTFADQLSYKKVVLDKDTVSEDGTFFLEWDVERTTYAMLEIGFQQGEIFLSPGLVYELEVWPEEEPARLAYYDRPMLDIRLPREADNGINRYIREINQVYNEFLLNNPKLFQSPSRKSMVEEVSSTLRNGVENSKDEYIKDFVRYKIASLELFFRTRSNETLASLYLTGQPVLYGNVEYMDFFHLYFEKYLLTNNPYLPYSKTSALINEKHPLEEVMKEMLEDPVLADRRLAEMVLMSGLKEMSTSSGFKQERIIELLDQIRMGSQYDIHRVIAKNLKDKILWMKPGTPAPDFQLEDVLGKPHKLEDYKGKYLYLSFVDLYSPSSLAELNILADVYPDYSDRIYFVSIMAGELKPGWSDILASYRIDWPLLLGGRGKELLEQYGATALPVFILIDPEGDIQKYPAPSPSEDLPALLNSL